MVIPYYQINQYIINSVKKTYANLLKPSPTILFEDYLKSQLHFNIVGAFHGRSLIVYQRALDYINRKETGTFDAYKETLLWYYNDVSMFVLNDFVEFEKNNDFSILDSNIPRLDEVCIEEISLNAVYDDLGVILEKNESPSQPVIDYSVFANIPMKSRMSLTQSRLLTEAIAMQHAVKKDKVIKFTWR